MAARLFRLFWLAVLLGHAILAILWWWLQPGGFPISHPRFWSNRVAPIAVLALASGRLGQGEALSITLLDQGRPAGRITLDDWARQADTSRSPTAGWDVPVNAIEFSLSGEKPETPASIFVTLAGTSVGRGWDCVGHAAGTYRNRILFEKIEDSGTSSAARNRPVSAGQSPGAE